MISVAIEPKTKADQDKLGVAMQRLAQEDPTFRVSTEPDTGQTLISGMGELHLEIIVDRMLREYNVQANVGRPQVAYRETIRKKAEAEGKYIKQTGGSGQYGHCKIELHPMPSPAHENMNEMSTDELDALAKEVVAAVLRANGSSTRNTAFCLSTRSLVDRFPANSSRRSKREFAKRWTTASWQAFRRWTSPRCWWTAATHDVDSYEMAFKIAGLDGLQGGLREGQAGAA